MPLSHHDYQYIAEFLNKHKINHKKGWQNFSLNQKLLNALVININSIKELKKLMKKIDKLNVEKKPEERIIVRAAAGGKNEEYSESFSFTDCVNGDVILHLVGSDFQEISPTTEKNVVKVGAGVQIIDLDKILYEKFNLVTPTSSLIGHVTGVGLAQNSGHGTGKDQPSFAGLIKAMTLCLPNGKIVRIDKSHKDFETIRAAYSSLFGIVINIELECIEAKKVQCVREVRSIPELIDEIKNGLLYNDPYVSIMYVPTYTPDELTNIHNKNVIIYRFRPVEKDNLDVNNQPRFSHFGQELAIKLQRDFKVVDLFRQYAKLIPSYMKYIVSRIGVGTKDSIALGPWPDIFHYQTAFPRDIDDADYLFEVSQDCNEIVTALTEVVKTLTEFAKNKEYPIIDAIYLRFFAGTNGGLSTSVHAPDKHVCGFDMVSSVGISGYEKFQSIMRDFFINKLKSKPHPGKCVTQDTDYEKIYGEDYYKFIEVLKSWYKDNNLLIEKSPYINQFFCKLLKLPFTLNANTDLISPNHCCKLSCPKKIAKTILPYIENDCEDGARLIKQLQKITPSESHIEQIGLFHMEQDNNNQEHKAEKKDKCCTLV